MQVQANFTTALGAEAITEISLTLRPLLAYVFAFYIKAKNSHWHMSGSHFRDYRLSPHRERHVAGTVVRQPSLRLRRRKQNEGASHEL